MSRPNEGFKLAMAGAEQAVQHANEVNKGWGEEAFEMIKRYPEKKFMTESVAAWAYLHGLTRPPSGRAWGAVVMRAYREGYIKRIGYEPVANPRAHSTPASVWERVKPKRAA